MTTKPQAKNTIREILNDSFSDHEDSDHGICESRYVTCNVCYERIYYMNTHYHTKHTATSLFKPNKCNCYFGGIVKETTQELETLITEARANERQAMLDALNGLYDPEYVKHIDTYMYGFNHAIDKMESAIKLRGGSDE